MEDYNIKETYFVSDDDACIYFEGTYDECKAYLNDKKEKLFFEILPPIGIYKKCDWFNIFVGEPI